MKGDRQIVLVAAPQLVKQHFGLGARVHKHEREPMRLDRPVDLGEGIARGVSRPGKLGLRAEDGDVGLCPLAADDDLGKACGLLPLVRHEVGGKLVRACDGGREADRGQLGRMAAQPREIERKEIAALARGERVQLVEDDVFERAEQIGGALVRQHQRDLLGGGEEHVGRRHALARAALRRRVAGARLEPYREAHLLDGRCEVPRDVRGERLERRDIEGVKRAAGARALRLAREIGQAREETRERLAAAGRGDEKRIAPLAGGFEQRELMGVRLPASAGEPGGKRLRQGPDGRLGSRRQPPRCASRHVRPA